MITLFEDYIPRGKPPFTPLKKLFNFLKKKELKVKYFKGGRQTAGYSEIEHISGEDFLIYFDAHYGPPEKFRIRQMYGLQFNEKGERCGSWISKYFHLNQFNEIYEFVKDIAETNNMEVDLKKYNL